MRKAQQANILDLLKTLKEAHGELPKQNTTNAVTNLLADCQDFALQIKGYIEAIEGEGTKAVALLEEYCEIAYHASASLETANWRKLAKQLAQIENSVRVELRPDRIEMVFFPYQLSMWDSLESIYLAAVGDPNCDAYVVPIPWYEKKPDGTFGEMHYDGDQYPDNIPVTDWREYDVEARHPEAIFIHNPYDEGNYVSSVHPSYFSKRLKDCTDLLCYVPYFVCTKRLSEHFATVAACVYSHKVFVQSEEIRDDYIRILREWLRENGVGKGHPLWPMVANLSDKFVALGSPKFDKAINTKRGDCELPDEWARLMAGKKVFLYNTAVGTLLHYSEQYLEKLRSVLAMFREREDVLLWWRPHPLLESTLASMRPELLEKYRQIVAEYRDSGMQGQGSLIFDQSNDLHRAIALSDAYIGDASSLVTLYQTTGKPLILQYVNRYPLIFRTFIQVGDYYWFVSSGDNGLFRMKTDSDQAEYVYDFPNEQDIHRLFASIARYKSKLIFVPLAAKAIHFYDTETGEGSFITIKECEKSPYEKVGYLKTHKFMHCVVWEDSAFIFPCGYPAIVKCDMLSMQLEYLHEPLAMLSKSIVNCDVSYFYKSFECDSSSYLWCAPTGSLLEFSLKSGEVFERFVIGDSAIYLGIAAGDYYWLIPRTKGTKIVRLSRDFADKKYFDLPKDFVSGKHPFLAAIVAAEKIYAFPNTGNAVVVIDVISEEVRVAPEFDIDPTILESRPTGDKYSFAQLCQTNIAAFDMLSAQLVIYDTDSEQMTRRSIGIQKKAPVKSEAQKERLREELSLAAVSPDFIVRETPIKPLALFVDIVCHDEFAKASASNADTSAGQKIYDYVKGGNLPC
jgi:hypothetical protein